MNSKLKKFNINKKAMISMAFAGIVLTGCGNKNILDMKYTFNKAIIFGDNNVTIVKVEKWDDYDGEQIQIQTPEGLYILTSSYDTKLIDDRNSDISAEDLARGIMGEDVIINYLNEAPQKTK